MHLTRYTDYGLRVLMLLATRPDEHVTSEEIASTFGISRNHLLKVVQRLARLGYVEARRGPAGGVRFRPATASVTVGEIVRALEPRMALVECFDDDANRCPITAACQLAPLLDRARDAFLSALDDTTLGDLTRAHGRGISTLLAAR